MNERRASLVFSFADKASSGMKRMMAGSGKLKAALDAAKKSESDLKKQFNDVSALRRYTAD